MHSNGTLKHSTYYVRDAQGNIMSTYDYLPAGSYLLTERDLYGSSRLGILSDTMEMLGASSVCTLTSQSHWLGKKKYELTNHLGNVLATVSDRKLPMPGGSLISYFQPDILSATDYYPFGMEMAGRTFSLNYRYGFNGKEKDDEIQSSKSSINYEARIYDSKLGRFLSVDPRSKQFPFLTSYQFASNTPIWGVDQDGEEVRVYTESPAYYRLLVGHTFITVGDGDNIVVYTYGRYAEVNAPSGGSAHSLNSLSPTGQGVLRRLTGKEAQEFLKKAFENEEVNVYEITDADEQKTAQFFEDQFNSPNAQIPSCGPYIGDPNSRVVDLYDLENNNCTTKSCEAVEAGGSQIFKETTQEVMRSEMYKSGMDYEFRLKGTGQYQTSPVVAPWTPAGTKQFLDYQDQTSKNPVKNVTNDIKTQYNIEN